ncbi:MAG TPA: PQQ-binding-like beta-propeller repeat protein [Thermoanaerobaculia bacterium]|nr:PQQ-binding-like beta-propeller repeat protein [Thermoanaerobaculia bacterium]
MRKAAAVSTASLLVFALACRDRASPAADWIGGGADWPGYLGGPASSQWSRLDQLHPGNVERLEVAWVYHAGGADVEDSRSQIQCNPLILDGVLYGVGPRLDLFALDAATGRRLWRFDPGQGEGEDEAYGFGIQRGLAWWQGEPGQRRLFYAASERLFAIDAATGEPIRSFGDGGEIDLGFDRRSREEGGADPAGSGDHQSSVPRAGGPHIGQDASGGDAADTVNAADAGAPELYVAGTTPGVVFEDLLIVGVRVSETLPAAPGDVRAFDVRTGELVWTFRTIPASGEPGHETWPAGARRRSGGANAWAGMSLDAERGVVYAPTGSASYDFYGADRIGRNLYASSILALDARTGERIWHYQVVRHDVWDRDLPAPPNLVTVEREGRPIDAVAQITKSGHVFVLDRDRGEPLWPIEEVPVEPSDLPGEELWPSQPLPSRPPPFARQALNEENATRRTPAAREWVLERLARLRTGAQFVAPSREGTVILPGFDGGGEWGGAAWDPETGWLYVSSSEMPWVLTMVEVTGDGGDFESAEPGGRLGDRARPLYAQQCAVCHGVDRQGDRLGEFPGLLGLGSRRTRAEVVDLLAQGSGRMPSYAHLSEEEREALLALLFDTGEGGSQRARGVGEPVRRAAAAEQSAAEQREEVVEAGSAARDDGGEAEDGSRTTFVSTGYHRFLDPDGYPAVASPWGTLTAIDLSRGEIVWQVPLGDRPEARAPDEPPTGTELYGGPIVTAGGLVFVSATRDERIRAFDKRTGAELWSARLPAGGYATPATYEVDGRQFVVVAAGGGKMGTPSGDAYVAFALPVENVTGP